MRSILSRLLLTLALLSAPIAAAQNTTLTSELASRGIKPMTSTNIDAAGGDPTARGAILAGARSGDGTQRASPIGASPSFRVGVTNFTPAATPTDIGFVGIQSENRAVVIRRISMRAVADAASLVDVFINFRGNNTSGVTTYQGVSLDATPDGSPSGYFGTWAANPSASTIGTIAQGKLQIGTAAAPAPALVFEWPAGQRAPTMRGVIGTFARQIAVNLAGATMPANVKFDIEVLWDEEPARRIYLFGDSLIDGAQEISRGLLQYPGVLGTSDVRRLGNNGKRALDVLPIAAANLSGLNYSVATLVSGLPAYGTSPMMHDVVYHFLTNDIRQGTVTTAQAISLIDAFLYIIKNGCQAGATWTSTAAGGAGTSFTWNATIAARPNTRIWLWGPNSYLADDPGSTGLIPLTGLFAGMTQAQASQAATDMVYAAYEAFRGDARVAGVYQSQDFVSPVLGIGFGRMVKTAANNPLMIDILHPNATGRFVKTEQLASFIPAR